jgi:guanylate kinase
MTLPTTHTGILFVLSGPSGVGKDTVLRRALPKLGRIRTSISATTRAPRPREAFGVDYFFVTRDEFLAMQAKGDLLEHALVHDNFYGTPRSWVLEQLQQGIDVVLAIDVQGALQVRKLYPEAVLIFIAPPSWDELSRRLRGRGTEDDATVQRRLENARTELSRAGEYNYLVINDNLHEATDRLRAIVIAERSRPARQGYKLPEE